MKNSMQNSMSDALRNKRARGLDVAIIIGGAEPVNSMTPLHAESAEEAEKEQKELGLAPDAQPLAGERKPDEMGGAMEQELGQMGLGKSSLAYRAKMRGK